MCEPALGGNLISVPCLPPEALAPTVGLWQAPPENAVYGLQLRGKVKQGKREVRLDDDYDSEEDSDYDQAGDEEVRQKQ